MRMKIVALFVICAYVSSLDETDDDYRKHYGLSFSNRCRSYHRVFKCMSSCKAMNFQVFRINHRCRCTCHETKTTTILPFFQWRTNGTTRGVPPTYSVSLYHIVGTLSPQPTSATPEVNLTTLPACEDRPGTKDNDSNINGTDANATEGNATEGNTTEGGVTEGDATEGGTTEGATEGSATEGGATEGSPTEGEATEDGATEGEAKEGNEEPE